MPEIIPIRDLKNTNAISQRCHETAEPIFVTKNGYGDMVIMSNETYEKSIAMSEVYKSLLLAQKQIDNGETSDGDSVLSSMREKYGYDV